MSIGLLGLSVFASLVAVLGLAQPPAVPPPVTAPFELNTVLMQTTVFLSAPSAAEPGKFAIGSGVVVARPCGASAPGRVRYTLVTAAHVLEDMSGDVLTVQNPVQAPDGSWSKSSQRVALRDRRGKLWKKHPDADVAAIDVVISVPRDRPDIPVLPASLFATDDVLKLYEIHPGDEVIALGFPDGTASTAAGFPLLRSGRISSYPLMPQKVMKTWTIDMEAIPGVSGGPVYFIDRDRTYGNVVHVGQTIGFLMGIVTQTQYSPRNRIPLRYTTVAPAVFVLETIAMMPIPNCSS